MQDDSQRPLTEPGGEGVRPVFKVVLGLALLVLVLSFVKLFQSKHSQQVAADMLTETATETAADPAVESRVDQQPRPVRRIQPIRPRANVVPAESDFLNDNFTDTLPSQAVSNLWRSVASPQVSGYLTAARLPELRPGLDGLLARFEPLVYYRIPATYGDELRKDFGRITEATNELKQFVVDFLKLKDEVEQSKQDFLRTAYASDEIRQNQAAAYRKKLLDLQALYLERKRQFAQEYAALEPSFQDPPGVFEKKFELSQKAAQRYQADIIQLESGIYDVRKQIDATAGQLTKFSGNVVTAVEETAREAIGRLNVLSNGLYQRVGSVNGLIRDYNAKLGRYGSPATSVH